MKGEKKRQKRNNERKEKKWEKRKRVKIEKRIELSVRIQEVSVEKEGKIIKFINKNHEKSLPNKKR